MKHVPRAVVGMMNEHEPVIAEATSAMDEWDEIVAVVPSLWARLTVVIAADGYPGSYQKGSVIKGLDALPEDSFHMAFHAGTTLVDGQVTASAGRVLNITARGETLAQARARAYAMVDTIDWPEGFCRSDIGWRAL